MSTMQSYATEPSCLCGDSCSHWGACTVMHTLHHMPSRHRRCADSALPLASGAKWNLVLENCRAMW